MFAVDDREGEAELCLQFVSPLLDHPGRRNDQREIQSSTRQHFAEDQSGLDCLAQVNVVRDQQADACKPRRLARWRQLIRVKADTSTKRRLEKITGGGCRRAPAQRPEISGEHGRVVSAVLGERGGVINRKRLGLYLGRPGNLDGFANRKASVLVNPPESA